MVGLKAGKDFARHIDSVDFESKTTSWTTTKKIYPDNGYGRKHTAAIAFTFWWDCFIGRFIIAVHSHMSVFLFEFCFSASISNAPFNCVHFALNKPQKIYAIRWVYIWGIEKKGQIPQIYRFSIECVIFFPSIPSI